jgi:enoyl-CoA hydratase/carnithine racemase
MIYGFCMGGAIAIAMACDLRFAAEGAKFGIPAARLGIVYGLESVRHLVDLVGPSCAKDILFSGRTFDAQEAAQMGFVNRVVPASALAAYTFDYLRQVAANAPLSIRGAKMMIEGIVSGEDQEERLRKLPLEVFDSHDYQEGVQAFLEKRPPRFEGR